MLIFVCSHPFIQRFLYGKKFCMIKISSPSRNICRFVQSLGKLSLSLSKAALECLVAVTHGAPYTVGKHVTAYCTNEKFPKSWNLSFSSVPTECTNVFGIYQYYSWEHTKIENALKFNAIWCAMRYFLFLSWVLIGYDCFFKEILSGELVSSQIRQMPKDVIISGSGLMIFMQKKLGFILFYWKVIFTETGRQKDLPSGHSLP